MVKLLFAGDLVPPETSGCMYSDELLEVLQDKDFSIVNLETPLTRSSQKILKTGNNFKRPPECISHIKDGHFDAVALSNNHIRDYGDQGVFDTLETCRSHGIMTLGAGKNSEAASQPLVVEVKGRKIAFLNYSEREFNIAYGERAGANPFDVIDAFYQVQEAKGCYDYVIVIYHGGVEYHYLPTPGMVCRFKYLIDVGADCVVSHHTHRYSSVIGYNERPIFFGVGNFLAPTKAKADDIWRTGVLAQVKFGEERCQWKLTPTVMSSDLEHVGLAGRSLKPYILQHVDELSETTENMPAIKNYWESVCHAESDRLLNLIKSESRLEYRIRKRLISVLKPGLSQYKVMNILNMIRCDAQREILLAIFESKCSGAGIRIFD